MGETLEAAFDAFVDEISDCARFIREHPFYREPENRAAGYALLASMVLARLEGEVVFDPDHPSFRIVDTRTPEAAPNPDQRYLISKLEGGATYRVWGTLGSVRRLDFQVYAGDPFVAGSGGRSAAFLTFEQLSVAGDGTFEVAVSAERRPGNWLENPDDGTMLIARQIFSDWEDETPGEVHIDRVGNEGALKPVLSEQELARRLGRAATVLRTQTHAWPALVERRYLAQRAPNEVSEPIDPTPSGGVSGRWMSHGLFDLADDEALIVRTWPADGNYQGIQLADMWFSTLEYCNRQSSLTGDQARRDSDGSYRFVICSVDPGVPNWLDTVGRRRGLILLRYDGTSAPSFDPARYPTAAKVSLSTLRDHLPADTPVVSAQERARVVAGRRRHVQRRFGT